MNSSQNNNIDLFKDIIKSVDNEITFYRKKIDWVIMYSLILLIAIITGQQTVKTNNPELVRILYVIIIVLITFFSTLFIKAYLERIYFFRTKRIEIIKELIPENLNPYPEPIIQFKFGNLIRPNFLFIYLIIITSVLSLILILFGK